MNKLVNFKIISCDFQKQIVLMATDRTYSSLNNAPIKTKLDVLELCKWGKQNGAKM